MNKKAFLLTRMENDSIEGKRIILHMNKTNYYFYYDSYLQVQTFCTGTLSGGVLIGEAYQMEMMRDEPIKECTNLGAVNRRTLFDMVKTWTGRWVLIVDGLVIPDASSLMGIFYDEDGNVTNDINTLRSYDNLEYKSVINKYTSNLNWYPGPQTPYSAIKRLLANQVYELNKCRTDSWPLLDESVLAVSETERIQLLADMWKHAVQALYRAKGDRICFAITGGYDSRCALALMEYSKVPYSLFVLDIDGMNLSDKMLPRKIAKTLNRKLHFIKKNPTIEKDRITTFREFVSEMVQDKGEIVYAQNQYASIFGNVILRSSIWETVIDYYNCGKVEDLNSVKSALHEENMSENFQGAFSEFIEIYKNDTMNNNISFSNYLLRLERVGCWLSSIERGFDIYGDDITSLQLCNCTEFVSLLNQFPQEERKTKFHQRKIIAQLYPQLDSIPYEADYEKKIWAKSYRKIVRLLKRLR